MELKMLKIAPADEKVPVHVNDKRKIENMALSITKRFVEKVSYDRINAELKQELETFPYL